MEKRVRRPEGGTALSACVQRTEEIEPEILAAAVRGDDEAFVSVMRHYDRRLRIVAYHVVGNRQLMDDVLQEVTLRAYRSLSRFRGDSSLGTWLCRITYRASCDALARADRLYPMPPDELPEPRDAEPDPAEALAMRAALTDALAALPPEQRLAVLLVDREGYDYATTAEILGVPVRDTGLATLGGAGEAAQLPQRVTGLGGDVMDEFRDRELGELLETVTEPDHGPDYWDQMRAHVAEEAAERRRPGLARRIHAALATRRLRVALVAATVVAAVAAAVLIGLPRTPGPETVSAAVVLERALRTVSSGRTWQADAVIKAADWNRSAARVPLRRHAVPLRAEAPTGATC